MGRPLIRLLVVLPTVGLALFCAEHFGFSTAQAVLSGWIGCQVADIICAAAART